jgi:3'(2'), 5'-bisphosphate nucleotidase
MPPAVDGAFARWLAEQTGRLLVDLRREHGHGDAAALRAAGDKRAHDLIMTLLTRWRPGDAVLSEEGVPDDPARLTADRVWIVDPLDGTREYGEPDRVDWAVHIGLWVRGCGAPFRLAAGAVALPAQSRVLGTDFPPGYPPMSAASAHGDMLLACSRSRPPEFLTEVAGRVGATLVPMGSAGAKIAAVVAGDVDGYLHAGGQFEWDSAAPVAVATATGLHASRIDGSALEYNKSDPTLPDVVVCRKDLAPRLLAAVRSSR